MSAGGILCWERRLCVREWDWRCLGTAMEAKRLLEAKLAELGPARVGLALVLVVGSRSVEVLPADGAEAEAILAAHDLRRQRQSKGITGPALQVQVIALDVRRAHLVACPRLVNLARVHGHGLVRRLQAAHARTFELSAEAQAQGIAGAGGAGGVERGRDGAVLEVVALTPELEPVG